MAGLACARWLGCSAVPQVGAWDLGVRVGGAARSGSIHIHHPKADQDGHGQHGHGRILINDAANYKIQLPVGGFLFETGNR
jgi:hypothetical protein